MLSESDKTRLIALLRRCDLLTLGNLVGPSVIQAIRQVHKTDVERRIAEVLLFKYGDEILASRDVRTAIIDSLTNEEAINVASKLRITDSSHLQTCNAINAYFKNWTASKSQTFAECFGLSSSVHKRRIVDDRQSVELISLVYGESLDSTGHLHPYQKTVKDQVNQFLFQEGRRQIIVQMPTGAGKTFTMLESVVDVLRTNPSDTFIFWLVNSNELAQQAFEAFSKLWKQKGDRNISAYRFHSGISAEMVRDDFGIAFGSFSTVNPIINDDSHHSRSAFDDIVRKTHTLIVDEAHSSPAETYQACIDRFLNRANPNLVGLTATPGRNCPESMERLVDLYDRSLVQIQDERGNHVDDPVSYLQKEGYLAKIDFTQLETGVSTVSTTEATIRDELAGNGQRNRKIIEQIEAANEGRESTLVFSCSLDHVYALDVLCKARDIESHFIVGDTPTAVRQELLSRFRDGQFNILINYDVLSAGIDIPKLDHIIITRPVGSPVLYSQILGRALRGPKNGGQTSNKVTTLVDNIEGFGDPQMLFQLFWERWGL